MVSLGEDTQRTGGYFFDHDAPSSTLLPPSREELFTISTLGTVGEVTFKRIKTIWAVVVMIIVMVALEIAAFLLPYFEKKSMDSWKVPPGSYSLMIYSHAVVWFVYMLMDRYLKLQHNISRTRGYLEFYRKTKNIRRTPLMIISGANAMLLILTVSLHDYCKPGECKDFPLDEHNFMQITVSIETLIILVVLIQYAVWTVQFNRKQAPPDVHQDDTISAFMHSHTQSQEIGFRDEDYMDETLEKQADLIRYLKHHNNHLGKKIIALTEQLNEKT